MESDARSRVPIGLEKVLLLAAQDPAFKQRLLSQRLGALKERGLALRPSEQTVLRAVPEAQLRAAIERLDVSPYNVERRRFLGLVAASTALTASGAGGCSEAVTPLGIRPGDWEIQPRDQGQDRPVASPDAFVPPDRPVPPPDTAPPPRDAGSVDITDLDTGLDASPTNGIRPKG
jgi:hypothetical protein